MDKEEQINQYIHEARGLCWHDWIDAKNADGAKGKGCKYCRRFYYYTKSLPIKPNYLEHGKAWGEMLNWTKDKDWWCDFSDKNSMCAEAYLGNCIGVDLFADPTALATGIVKYLEGLNEDRN